jgi:hypothetical protein
VLMTEKDLIARALMDTLHGSNGSAGDLDELTLVDGLVQGLGRIATALKYLGLADAATPFGAIEALCMEMKESSERIAYGLEAIAEAIRDHGA